MRKKEATNGCGPLQDSHILLLLIRALSRKSGGTVWSVPSVIQGDFWSVWCKLPIHTAQALPSPVHTCTHTQTHTHKVIPAAEQGPVEKDVQICPDLASKHTHTHTHSQQAGLSGPSTQEESSCWGFTRLVRWAEAQRRGTPLRLSFFSSHCAQKVETGENCGLEIGSPCFLSSFPLFTYFSYSPLKSSPLFCLTVWCTCSAASTACCSVMSSCTPRPAAWPSPARSRAARPGRGSIVSGTAPRRPACPGRATLLDLNSSSYRPPVIQDHVGVAAIALKSCICARLPCETNPRRF